MDMTTNTKPRDTDHFIICCMSNNYSKYSTFPCLACLSSIQHFSEILILFEELPLYLCKKKRLWFIVKKNFLTKRMKIVRNLIILKPWPSLKATKAYSASRLDMTREESNPRDCFTWCFCANIRPHSSQ